MEVNIRDMIGVPYRAHGRDFGGMDCYGVVIEFYRRQGVEFPDVFYLDPEGQGVRGCVLAAVRDGLPVERIAVPEYGCVVEMSMRGGSVSHMGVYVGGGNVLHSTSDMGVCVQDLARFGKVVKGFWRVKK